MNSTLLNEISHMFAINLSVCYIQILETRIRLPILYRGKSFQHEKSMNEGFLLKSNYDLEGIHIEGNPSKNEKSRNEGFLFNFYL